jgi:hypothetical protein
MWLAMLAELIDGGTLKVLWLKEAAKHMKCCRAPIGGKIVTELAD